MCIITMQKDEHQPFNQQHSVEVIPRCKKCKSSFFFFFFLVERQGNIRRLYSKRASDDEKTKHKKTKFKILKDPFIMSGCAVHLAE